MIKSGVREKQKALVIVVVVAHMTRTDHIQHSSTEQNKHKYTQSVHSKVVD